jgi:hypothetical protein
MFKLALALAVVGAFAADTAAPIISLDLPAAKATMPAHTKFHNAGSTSRKSMFPNAGKVQDDGKTPNHFEGVCEVNTNAATTGYGPQAGRVYTTCKMPKVSAFDHHDGVITKIDTSGSYFLEKKPATIGGVVTDCKTAGGCSTFNAANPKFNRVGMLVLEYAAEDSVGNPSAAVDYALIIKDEAKPEAKKDNLMEHAKYGHAVDTTKSYLFTTTDAITREDSYDGVIKGVQTAGSNPHVNTCSTPGTRRSTVQWCDTAGLFGYSNANNCFSAGRTTIVEDDEPVPITIQNTEEAFESKLTAARSGNAWEYECRDNWAPHMCKEKCGKDQNYAQSAACNCDDGKLHGKRTAAGKAQKIVANVDDFANDKCKMVYTTNFGGKSYSGDDQTEVPDLDRVTSAGVTFTVTATAFAQSVTNSAVFAHSFKVVDTTHPIINIVNPLKAAWKKWRFSEVGKTIGGSKPIPNTYSTDGKYTAGNHKKGNQDHTYDESQNMYGTHNQLIQHSAGYVEDVKQIKAMDHSTFSCADACTTTDNLKKQAKYRFFANADHSCAVTDVEADRQWQPLATLVADDLSDSKAHMTPYLVIQYSCEDDAGLVTAACRTIFNQDHTLPIVNIVGDAKTEQRASDVDSYVDQGATCSDAVDGQINSRVEVSGDIVDLRQVGTYHITYDCQDSAGNMATGPGNVRQVIVQDTICPSCDLTTLRFPQTGMASGARAGTCTGTDLTGGECTIEASFKVTDGGLQAAYQRVAETCEDDHVSALRTPKSKRWSTYDTTAQADIDVTKVGTYYVVFTVEDAAGNTNHHDNQGVKCALCDQNNQIKHIQVGDEAELCGAKGEDTHTTIPGQGKQEFRKSQFRKVVVVDNEIPVITIRPAQTKRPDAKKNGARHPSNGAKWNRAPLRQDGSVIAGFPTSWMAETSATNGWVVGALASAVAAVALLGMSNRRTAVTSVPV